MAWKVGYDYLKVGPPRPLEGPTRNRFLGATNPLLYSSTLYSTQSPRAVRKWHGLTTSSSSFRSKVILQMNTKMALLWSCCYLKNYSSVKYLLRRVSEIRAQLECPSNSMMEIVTFVAFYLSL